MTTTVTAKIQVRKGTSAQWTSANPTLLSGEIGFETDTGKLKIGDGATAWTSLIYTVDPAAVHISDHGLLSGLSDDDHAQYHTDARGDARYAATGHTHAGTYEPADATILKQADVDDTPVNGVTTAPVSSNWAYDHAALATAHGISAFGSSLVDDADASTARGTLGLGTAAVAATGDFAAASHAHAASAITSGTIDPARLGSGSASASTYLRGDQTWAAAAGGVASETHAATEKTTPVDADELPLVDSAASFVLKRLTWANIKTTLSGVFALLAGKNGGQTLIGGTEVGDALSLQGTSGNGTVTGTALAVKVGNNGALTALTVANNGQLTIKGDATTDLPVYGSELLTSAGWTVNTGWTESPDDTFAHTSGTDTLTHSATITSTHKYQISWTVTGRTAGSFTVAVGGQSLATQSATGTFGPTATAATAFTITPTTDFNGTLSQVSLKRITAASTPNRVMNNSAGVVIGEERGNSTSVFLGIGAGSYNTTGANNCFIGLNSGNINTTGYNNNCIGSSAGRVNTTGYNNNFIGSNSGYNNSTGTNNNFIGSNAGFSSTTGTNNNFIGPNAGYSNTTGSSNCVIGVNAGYGNTTGSSNCVIGVNAGRFHADGATALTDPESSVYIGNGARGKDNADSNSVVIGGNIPIGLGANTTVIGTSATTLTRLYGDIGLGVDAPSAKVHSIKTTEQLRLGYDASNYASFTVDSAGNLTLANTGTTPSVYIATLRSGCKVTAVTTTASPAATDAGTVYTNEGDVDGATITLPTAAAGLNFIAYVQAAQTLTVTAGSGDTIRIAGSVTAAAGSITSNVVGSSVTLVAINATEWVATASIGSWSF